MHEWIGNNKVLYQNTAKALHNEHVNTILDIIIIASYYFQSLIGLAHLLPAISCYKSEIFKDYQENMKVTIICDLAVILFVCSH